MLKADDVRETPSALFQARAKLHGPFTLDACATHANALAPQYYHEHDGLCLIAGESGGLRYTHVREDTKDGLTGTWRGRVWCNPPFSQLWSWVAKAWQECARDSSERWMTGVDPIPLIVIDMLCPGTRCEQVGWQRLVEPYRDGKGVLVPGWRLTTTCLPERQHFLQDGKPILEEKPRFSKRTGEPLPPRRSSPKFGCTMLTWEKVR